MVQTRLTEKQQLFIKEFLVDLNATQAAIRAGYSKKTANRIASENLSKPDIQEAIAMAMQARNERVELDADYVLQQARKVHERCMQEIRPIMDRAGKHMCDEEGNGLFRFDSNGALKALEIIGKHVDVRAFKDRQEIDINLPTVIVHDPERGTYREGDDDV